MVKKVKYTLIDTNILPANIVCRNNAYEIFISLDERFSSEWAKLTSDLNDIRGSVVSKFIKSGINIGKSELFFSSKNNCGLLLIK